MVLTAVNGCSLPAIHLADFEYSNILKSETNAKQEHVPHFILYFILFHLLSFCAALRFHVTSLFFFFFLFHFLLFFETKKFIYFHFLFLDFYSCENLLKVIHQSYQHNENEIKNSTGLTRPSNSYISNSNNNNNRSNRNQNQNAAPVVAAMEATIAMPPMVVMEANHHSFLHARLVFIHMNCQW